MINIRTSSNPIDNYLNLLPDYDFISLNDAYYNQKIEMLIITPDDDDYYNACVPLMEWKNEKGVKTIILRNFTSYSGSDNAEKIRNMIIDFYNKENIQWILLAADADTDKIPIREVYNPDVIDVGQGDSEYSNWDDYIKPTDYYYADLTGSWNNDGDAFYGESAKYNTQGIDEIDWIPEVYVGRLPASSAAELEDMVSKTIKYEKNPEIGNWMNNMLLGGVVSSYSPPEDEARLTEYIWENYVEPEMNFTHLHITTSSFTPNSSVDPSDNVADLIIIGAYSTFDDEFNDGYSTVIFAGHGSSTAFQTAGGDTVYSSDHASSASNINMPSLVYGDACTTAAYDKNDYNIGENLLLNPTSGAIGYIGGLRVTWYIEEDTDFEWLNRANLKLFWKEFFENKVYQQGKTLYDSKVAYMNSQIFEQGITSMSREYHRKNVLTYCLLGDPEVDIYTNTPKSVLNPFTQDIYEGQLVTVTIKNNISEIVPYARVHLTTANGKYRTIYADKNGVVNFRVYPTANEIYNVTITGHNLVPSYFNFTTMLDTTKPNITAVECSNQVATSLTNIYFDVKTCDNASGIKDVIVLIINPQSGGYFSYMTSNLLEENRTDFTVNLNKLDPGEYIMIIASRDFSNNTKIYQVSFQFLIPIPITFYMLIVAIVIIPGLVGISIVAVYSGNKKYSIIFKRMEGL